LPGKDENWEVAKYRAAKIGTQFTMDLRDVRNLQQRPETFPELLNAIEARDQALSPSPLADDALNLQPCHREKRSNASQLYNQVTIGCHRFCVGPMTAVAIYVAIYKERASMKFITPLLRAHYCWAVLGALLILAGCGANSDAPPENTIAPDGPAISSTRPMGGEKSVTTFFVTSRGLGGGGDLGGLAGADAHCQSLANAEGAGDHTWRAYLSTTATGSEPAINARDRIGAGPWYNSGGVLIAANVEQLHSGQNRINKEDAVTERLDPVNGARDTPNMHDILTGSRPDGTAFEGTEDLTCGNWTLSAAGRAQVGHHDRMGRGEGGESWNSAHATRGCSQQDLEATGGAGLFYCFAID
jgi:hypothetical protein